MDPQLKAQLRQVVGYASTASLDYAGQVQVGSVATLWGRVEPRYREVPVGSGIVEERTSHMVILDEAWPLSEAETRVCQFWLPGESLSAPGRRAKVVLFSPDENGVLDHVEVIV
jgi:hypothetical protein